MDSLMVVSEGSIPMQTLHTRVNRLFEKAPALLLPIKWWVIVAFVISTTCMLYGIMSRFTMDMALESWFQEDDPAKLSLDAFRAQFGSDDGIYLVYRASDNDVFSQTSLATLAKLHQTLDDARIQPRE